MTHERDYRDRRTAQAVRLGAGAGRDDVHGRSRPGDRLCRAAALDASAEHDLFKRYASSAGQAGQEDGGITVLISHRFSTVRMADLIAVLDHGQLTECGTHRELMTARGLYAELFTLKARAYH
jgi:hypothetical protein